MKSILSLKKYFSTVQIYILENNSTDNTKSILETYQNRYPFVHLYNYSICKETFKNSIYFPKLKKIIQNDEKLLTKNRMMRMAILRDSILYAIKKTSFFPDIVIQIDIDIHRFSVKGILHSIAYYDTWDAICANGRKFSFCQHSVSYNLFFDTYALLPHNMKKNTEKFASKAENQHVYSPIKKGQPLYPIISGFSGLSIYKYSLIHNLSYYDSAQLDNFTQCEHVSFYKALRKQGHKRIYINPSLLVQYNSLLKAFLYAIGTKKIMYQGLFIKSFIRTLHVLFLPIIFFIQLFIKKR